MDDKSEKPERRNRISVLNPPVGGDYHAALTAVESGDMLKALRHVDGAMTTVLFMMAADTLSRGIFHRRLARTLHLFRSIKALGEGNQEKAERMLDEIVRWTKHQRSAEPERVEAPTPSAHGLQIQRKSHHRKPQIRMNPAEALDAFLDR